MRILLLALAASVAACGGAADGAVPPVRVYAAASVADALAAFGAAREAAGLPRTLLTPGSSSTLARQIAAHAPADVFVSADDAAADLVLRAGREAAGSRRVVARNRIVVAVPSTPRADAPGIAALADLGRAEVRRVAVGDPAHVPAGRYAVKVLDAAGLLEAVRPKFVAFDDVRRAAAACGAGEVDAALVYATDAAPPGAGLRIAAEIPEAAAPRVELVALVVEGAPAAAREWLDDLASPRGRAALERAGFRAPDAR
jgi:molybdate transport system substrate-binding protein